MSFPAFRISNQITTNADYEVTAITMLIRAYSEQEIEEAYDYDVITQGM